MLPQGLLLGLLFRAQVVVDFTQPVQVVLFDALYCVDRQNFADLQREHFASFVAEAERCERRVLYVQCLAEGLGHCSPIKLVLLPCFLDLVRLLLRKH